MNRRKVMIKPRIISWFFDVYPGVNRMSSSF